MKRTAFLNGRFTDGRHDGAGSVSWSVPPGRLTLVDYTMHNAVIQEPFCTTKSPSQL